MIRLGRIVLAIAVCLTLVVLATPSMADALFNLDVRQTYASIGVDETFYQFVFDLRTPLPSDQLYVEFETHLPETWFAQWCDTHTGICYIGDATISIPGGNVTDQIQVDFFPLAGEAAKGWVDFHIYRVSDPSTYKEVSFALGHAVTLPVPNFSFRANPIFRYANPGDLVEFPAEIKSNDNWEDQLIVTIRPNYPSDWFCQYCQTSTGVCYIADATIPFHANVRDTLRVDFFCGPNPAVGYYRLKVQSAANPAFWQAIPFGVMAGSVPSSVENGPGIGRFAVQAEPNPMHSQTDFAISTTSPSNVHLVVFDASGRQVLSRSQFLPNAGVNRIGWDARDVSGRPLPGGTYFYRVANGSEEARGKVIIAR